MGLPVADTPLSPTDPVAGPSRRKFIAGAAWAVPAVVTSTAIPAHAAASEGPTLTLTAPNMQAVAAGTTPLIATFTGPAGSSPAGRVVSFTGPSGTSFSPETATTDGSGVATTTLTTTDTWAAPGSTLTITATTPGVTGIAPLTVLGANAYAFGNNEHGMLGVPSTEVRNNTPAQLRLAFPSPVKAIAGGVTFTLALLEDGSVWGVGQNQYGELGDGTTTNRATWAKIPTLSNVTQIAAGANSGYALLTNGQVRAWGKNASGELGNGTTNTQSNPTPVAVSKIGTEIGVATQIAALSALGTAAAPGTAYALIGGQVFAWGNNAGGQLGNGVNNGTSYTNSNVPVPVSGITTATRIAASSATCYAITAGGVVRAWGQGGYGAIGDGGKTARVTPVTVLNVTGATDIAAGHRWAVALVDGQVYTWGNNGYGQLGDDSTTDNPTPTAVPALTGVTRIAAGLASCYAIDSTGAVRAWGFNYYGSLGYGSTDTASLVPVTSMTLGSAATFAGTSEGSNMFFLCQPPAA